MALRGCHFSRTLGIAAPINLSSMRFNLETSISAWRRPYEMHQAFSDEDIEELESGLRDRIDALQLKGLSQKKAFRQAVKRVGTFDKAEEEYHKVYWGKVRREQRIIHELIWRIALLRNHIRLAFRNLRKQKMHTLINTVGLALGLACSFFVFLWVQDELKHNRFLENGEQVHVAWRNIVTSEGTNTTPSTPKRLAETLKSTYPEIIETATLFWEQEYVVNRGELSLRETGTFASEHFFEIFTFPFIQGTPASALQDESSAVITDRLARKIFGDDWQQTMDVIGELITIDHRKDFIIRGVVEDIPEQSTVRFDILLSIEDFYAQNSWIEHWGNNAFLTYATFEEGAELASVNEKVDDIIMQYWDPEEVSVFFQPFEESYLYSDFEEGHVAGGRIDYVRMFSFAGLFLLLIACINFINLATARSIQRAREVGVRKAIGANKSSLFSQFLAESVLVATFSAFLALLCVILLLPLFNSLSGKQISLDDLNSTFFGSAVLITVLVGLLAGGYPALYLSAFNPLQALRSTVKHKSSAASLRKGLVVLQFALSVLLIVGTLAVYSQIQLIQNMDIGLDREDVIYVAQEGAFADSYDAMREELLKRPGIAEVTSTDSSPLSIGSSTGDTQWEGKDPNDDHEFYIVGANFHFVELMDMTILEGRSFSPEYRRDSTSFIVNEETAALIGDDVIGTELSFWGETGPVIGVVKNFEMNSMYTPIEPVIIRLDTDTESVYVKSHPGQTERAIASIAEVAETFNPDFPFDYHFLDKDYEQTYRSETILGKLALLFACIAIFVSCLGLFGLISFTTQQRNKEVGVRKVLGASVVNLVGLLTKEVTWLVLIGIGLALPVSYILVSNWLSEFEHQITLRPTLFILAGVAAISIAWLTVSFHSIKAALANPVKSLRYE